MRCRSCLGDKLPFTTPICPDCMHQNAVDSFMGWDDMPLMRRRDEYGKIYGDLGPSRRRMRPGFTTQLRGLAK